MKPVFQSIKHDPTDGKYGDCHRAAIATVLGLPLDCVPHFCHDNPSSEEFCAREQAFLQKYDVAPFLFAVQANSSLDHLLAFVAAWNGESFVYLLGGKSPRGFNHTVVCRGAAVAHDPSPEGGGIVGPTEDGHYWITVFAKLGPSVQPQRMPAAHRQSA